jgi:segregation and condensation protein A
VPDHATKRGAVEEEEEDDEFADLSPDEAREVLIARLIAYKQFRNAAAALGSRMEAESHMEPRCVGPDPEFLNLMPDYLEGISLRSLAVICADLDSRRDGFLLEAEHVAPRRLPIALTVATVDRLTRAKGHLTFSELLDGQETAENVVATFLAILELFKRGSVVVSQSEVFGEIDISRVDGAPAFELNESELTSIEENLG